VSVEILHGDCRDQMFALFERMVQVDSIVTDPPYHLTSIVKRFGAATAAPAKDRDGAYARQSRGFMGKQWDGGDIAFQASTWRLAFDLLKPGGHLLAFSGTRTYHRMACAIEDAGFEIRDQIGWAYGSGFPKSHDVSKAIDKAAGAAREVVGVSQNWRDSKRDREKDNRMEVRGENAGLVTAPATDAARQWQGWGTSLKPAWEPIVVARKPLIGTVAENVLAHGTGALNIDGCRIGTEVVGWGGAKGGSDDPSQSQGRNYRLGEGEARPIAGRWPANLIHDGSEEVLRCFPEIEESAARFFYTPKADAGDRLGSKHPTVKPVDLMAYLCRLVTPPGGLVLDPFAGSGTTGMACLREGFRAILIEREAEYIADIKRRLAHVKGEDTPLFASGV
jgi:DNA modification methylase